MIHKIIEILKTRQYSFSELMKELQIQNKKVLLNYLRKVERVCKEKGWKLIIYPARCKKCGYKFKDNLRNPTKCPKCKSEWIEETKLRIE